MSEKFLRKLICHRLRGDGTYIIKSNKQHKNKQSVLDVEGSHWWEFCKGPVLELIQFNILAKDTQIVRK